MSEKQHKNIETLEVNNAEQHESAEPKLEKNELAQAERTQAERLEAARHVAAAEADDNPNTSEELNISEAVQERDYVSKRPANKELKKITLHKEMSHIRRKLSKPDKLGSKVIHQPIVRAASELSSKTITRPSGLLGGGIAAFIGTSAYLYLTRYIGLKYNYSVFLFLLVAGFILGVVLEALIRLLRSKRSA